MNETTRHRNDARSSGQSDRPNVELETTTTRIETGGSSGSADDGRRTAEQDRAAEQARSEAEQTRERVQQAGDQVRHTATETGEQIRQQGRETAEMVRRKTAEQAEAVKQMAVDRVNGSKNAFATKICDVGEALRRASEDLESHNDSALASNTRQLASGVDGIGRRLRESDVSELVGEVEHFVRRNPTLTLGGLFVAGLAAARFLKAQPPRYQRPQAAGGASNRAPGGATGTRPASDGSQSRTTAGTTAVGSSGVGNSPAATTAVGTTPANAPSTGDSAGPGIGSKPVGGPAEGDRRPGEVSSTSRGGDVTSTSKAGDVTSATKGASGGKPADSSAGQQPVGRVPQGGATKP